MKTHRLILDRLLLATAAGFAGYAHATDYHVDGTTGNNGNNGTSATSPFQTIQHAVDQAVAGDTVLVHGGSYNERVVFDRSGSLGNPIVVQGYENDTAALDGTNFIVANGWDPLIKIDSVSYIHIKRLTIRNHATDRQYHNPIGVFVTGSANNIVLEDLEVHNIEAKFNDGRKWIDGADAHGIAVYGTSGTAAIRDVIINRAHIHDCVLGSSEALVINGNVEGFTVSNCEVHDNNNIGIDFIGYEGKCPVESLDRARNGTCIDNLVYNISSYGNPSYDAGRDFERSAGGIYVDGGAHIVIERNRVHDCDIGIELASEHDGKATEYVTVRNNFISKSYLGGLFLGGYDRKRGSTKNCNIFGNTFYHNDQGEDSGWWGEIHLQAHVDHCTFKNNIVWANPNGGMHVGSSYPWGTRKQPAVINFDYNVYYTSGTQTNWNHNRKWLSSFSEWQGKGADPNGRFIDPELVLNSTVSPKLGPDLHIKNTSPAIAGGTNGIDVGANDIDGEARETGGQIDIGADEKH